MRPEDLRFLRDRNVKLIIAACGTASSVIDSALTDRLPHALYRRHRTHRPGGSRCHPQ